VIFTPWKLGCRSPQSVRHSIRYCRYLALLYLSVAALAWLELLFVPFDFQPALRLYATNRKDLQGSVAREWICDDGAVLSAPLGGVTKGAIHSHQGIHIRSDCFPFMAYLPVWSCDHGYKNTVVSKSFSSLPHFLNRSTARLPTHPKQLILTPFYPDYPHTEHVTFQPIHPS